MIAISFRHMVVFSALLTLGLTAVAVQGKEQVKVGFIGPLTGGNSANGLGGRNSADLAVKLRNADPDAKYEYELVVLDDECKPDQGVQAATRMAADKSIIAAATHYCSAVAIATVDTYHRFGLPVIVWGAVLPDITYGNDYKEVHRVNGTMINQNETNAEFMTGLGYKTWAIIHDTTDYGQGHNEYFSKYLTENGGKILATFGVTADQQDFTAELTKIKSLEPEVLYFGGLTPIGIRIRAQMDKLGLDAQFEGTSGIVSDTFIEGLGDLAEGVLAFREGAPTKKLPGGQYFLEQYQEKGYAEPAEAYGPFAFAAMNLILDTIEEVGPDREAVQDALNQVKGHKSIVGEITFDDHGQNTVALITKFVVQDGEWVVWEDSEYATGQRTLNGLMLGMMYALVAVGFTLFFGVLDVINFSHGDVLMVGAFAGLATYLGLGELGVSWRVAQVTGVLLVAIVLMGLLGALVARYLVLPLKSAPVLNTLLITLMLGTFLREAIRLFYPDGANPKPFPALLPTGAYELGNFNLRVDNVLMLLAGFLVIVGVHLLINRTRLGLAIRAVAQDEETAKTMGINFTLIVLVTFAIGSGLAAFAGILHGLYYAEINFGIGLLLGAIGFSSAIIGGLGNIYGAIIGGFLFAALQTIGAVALPFASAYKDVFAFGVVILIMAWRPTGLISEKVSERV